MSWCQMGCIKTPWKLPTGGATPLQWENLSVEARDRQAERWNKAKTTMVNINMIMSKAGQTHLVQSAVEMVCIDGILPDMFFGREMAKNALRNGLDILANVFGHGTGVH